MHDSVCRQHSALYPKYSFTWITSILQVNKMALDERTNEDPLQFLIKSNDPARDELKILCQAESEESKKKWLGILKRQLQTQMDFLRALQAPIAYHNRMANDL